MTTDTPSVSVEMVINFLNEVNELDPTVLPRMINHRLGCNKALAEHPTVQVRGEKSGDGSTMLYTVGILGILNGLFGIRPDGYGYIAAHYDEKDIEHRKVLKFAVTPGPPYTGEIKDDGTVAP